MTLMKLLARVVGRVLAVVLLAHGIASGQVIGVPQTLTASGSAVFNVSGIPSVVVTITGDGTGSFVPQADPDGAGPLSPFTWQVHHVQADGSLVAVSAITGNGTYLVMNPGYMRIVFAWTRTGGTAVLTATQGAAPVNAAAASGASEATLADVLDELMASGAIATAVVAATVPRVAEGNELPAGAPLVPIGFRHRETGPCQTPTGVSDTGDIVAPYVRNGRLCGEVVIADPNGNFLTFASESVSTPDALLDVDETEDQIDADGGCLAGFYVANLHATAWRYVKFYNNTAANVVVGTTPVDKPFPIPPSTAGYIGLNGCWTYSTALTVAATTGLADADTGAPGLNEVVVVPDIK